LVLAVNVSAKQFHQKDFAQQVIALVKRYDINPKLLKLELTESMLVEDIETTIATMKALREICIPFSLDDFGTGYSSLQYLKRLPIDQLKIDLSFVKNIVTDYSDRAIVRTIISMAQSLNLDVIAEGVESDEQRLLLLSKGCSHFQGYLFSKPIPIKQFEMLLTQLKERQDSEIDESEVIALHDNNGARKRDHHLLSVLDSMPAMIGYWDKNLRNRFGNQAYATWFGITPTKMLGMHLKDVLGEKLAKLNWHHVEAVLRGERKVFERSIPTPDGKSHRHSLAEYIPDIVDGEVKGFYVHVTDISSVKAAQAELTRSETKFRKLYEATSEAVMLMEGASIIDCNPAALNIFGCSSKESFCSKMPFDLSPEFQVNGEYSSLLGGEYIEIAHRNGHHHFEWIHRRTDTGELFPAEVTLTSMESDGRLTLQAVVRDISERKVDEQNLEFNKKVLDATSDGFWLTDVQGQLQTANQAYIELIGYSLEELQHMHISQLEAKETSKDEVMAHAVRIIERGSDQFETQHRHKDGHLIDIEVTTSYLNETQQFAVFSRDITQRKKIDAAVRDSEEMLRGLYELSVLGIALADMRGRFIEFNEAFRQICGYPSDELKTLDYWKLTPKKYEADEQIQLEMFLRTGRYGPYEKEYIRKDGSLISIRLTGMCLTKRNGQKFIWSIVEDISKEKLYTLDLLAAKHTAEAASKAKSAFLSTISNEMSTPMNGVLGMAQLLQMPNLSVEEQAEFSGTLMSSAQSLLKLIQSIMEYSEIESEQIVLHPEICTPSFIVMECVGLMNHLAKAKGLQIRASLGNIDGQLYKLDSSRLRQMIRCLLDNAIKFSASGSILIEICERQRQGTETLLEFAVVDTGIGVPLEKQNQVFESFTQVDSSNTRKFGGAGLGLAIVKRLAKMMNGSVGVESEEGKSSRFWFSVSAQSVSEIELPGLVALSSAGAK
jgi:PAS domain S-box-containing protein